MGGAAEMPDAARRGFLAGATALGLALVAGCAERKPYSAVGGPLPAFRLSDIDGGEHASTDYSGIALVVNFWATWCPPCRAEMPDLDLVHRRGGSRGPHVLGFCFDQDANPVKEFRLRTAVSFPLIIDRDHGLANAIGIASYPTTLLVARNGRVTEVLVGPRPWPDYPGIAALL
jgi:thiol-disulfide isomerase/thioredoxin